MLLARVIQLVSAAVFVAASVTKALDASGSEQGQGRDRYLATLLSVGFLLVAAGQLVSLPSLASAFDRITALGTTKVGYNGLVVLGLLAVLTFFRSTADRPRGQIRMRRRIDVVVGLAVVLALAVLMAATVPPDRSNSVPNPGAGLTVFAFYLVGNAWFFYAYFRCFLYAQRYARRSRGALAGACATVALGLFAAALTSVLRLALVAARDLGVPESRVDVLNSINFAANSSGLLLVTLGIVILGAARVAQWRRRHRRFSRLEPLCSRLHDSVPDLQVAEHPVSQDAGRGRRPRFSRRYQERIVQCWDGILRLAPALNQVVRQRDPEEVQVAELAAAIVAATASRPPTGSDRAEAASPELLAVLVRGGDEGTETAADVLANISAEVARIQQSGNDPVEGRVA